MIMRPFPTWMEAVRCYERYKKLTPDEKSVYDTTGIFPEVATSLSGQVTTPERAEKDRKLALSVVKQLLLLSDVPEDSFGEGIVQDFFCKDNKKLNYRINQDPANKKLVPNSGLTKCMKRWTSTYPKFELFIIDEVEKFVFNPEDNFKASDGASKLVRLNLKDPTLQKAQEIIDRDMRLPSDLGGHKAKIDPPSPGKSRRVENGNFQFDVTLDKELSEEELQAQVETYLAGLVMEADKVSRCHYLTGLLTRAIKHNFNDELKVALTGSIKTGLAIKNSDLDLNIELPKDDLSYEEVEVYLNQLVQLLKELNMTKIKTIHRKGAKVPLIKCIDTSGVSIDLSLGNSTTIFKTALLAAYAQLHPTVRQLLLFIKGWASTREVNLPNNGTLNTYCHSTMLLTYLVMIGAIPNLQRTCLEHSSFRPNFDQDKCQKTVEVSQPPKCQLCGGGLPEKIHYGANVFFNDSAFTLDGDLNFLNLLRGYMSFMAFSLKTDIHAISLLNGGLVPRETIGHPLPALENIVVSISPLQEEKDASNLVKIDEMKLLVVEDPIDLTVNIATSGRPWSIDGLNWEFCRAYNLLKANQPIETCLIVPFVPPSSPHSFIKDGIYSRHSVFLK